MPGLAGREFALHHVVPAGALFIHADCRHGRRDFPRHFHIFGFRFQAVHAHNVPRDLEVMPHDAARLLPHVIVVVRPIFEEFFLHERTVIIIWEIFGNCVKRIFQKIRIAFFAGRQIEVDQIRGRMVADGVPVLFPFIRAERVAARIERNRIEMREIAAFGFVQVKAFKQVNRHFGVFQNARIAGGAVGLNRPGQRVNLLIAGNRVEIVAKFRGKHFIFALAMHIHAMIPVHDFFIGIIEAHVFAQIFRPFFGGFQRGFVAGDHIGGRHPVNHAGNRVRFLTIVVFRFFAAEFDVRSVIIVINRLIFAKLRPQEEFGNAVNLLNPPILFFEGPFRFFAPDEHQKLRVKIEAVALRIKHPIHIQKASRRQHAAHLAAIAPLARLIQIVHNPAIRAFGEFYFIVAAIAGFQHKDIRAFVKMLHIARNRV